MKKSIETFLVMLTALGLVPSPTRADEVKSGPVGRIGGHFEVRDITGKMQGKTACYVCIFSMEQIPAVVMIFSRRVDENLAKVIQTVDQVQKDNAKLKAVLVGLGDVGETDLRQFQGTYKPLIPLTIAVEKDGPKRYDLNKEAAVTVIIYELGGVVHGSMGFTDTKSAAAKAEDIAAPARKVLEKLTGSNSPRTKKASKTLPGSKMEGCTHGQNQRSCQGRPAGYLFRTYAFGG